MNTSDIPDNAITRLEHMCDTILKELQLCRILHLTYKHPTAQVPGFQQKLKEWEVKSSFFYNGDGSLDIDIAKSVAKNFMIAIDADGISTLFDNIPTSTKPIMDIIHSFTPLHELTVVSKSFIKGLPSNVTMIVVDEIGFLNQPPIFKIDDKTLIIDRNRCAALLQNPLTAEAIDHDKSNHIVSIMFKKQFYTQVVDESCGFILEEEKK